MASMAEYVTVSEFAQLGGLVVSIVVWMSSCFNLWTTKEVQKNVQELHVLVNSRLSELLRLTAVSSVAEGRKLQKDSDATAN